MHVALQVGRDPAGLVPGDAAGARWEVDVRRVDNDFRGPAVRGKRGERFLYLTWGDVSPTGDFAMFRRAKLMLDRVDTMLVDGADTDGHTLQAIVSLTDEHGCPRCGRVDPPAITWTVDDQTSGARSL